jgi:hypothetical protein
MCSRIEGSAGCSESFQSPWPYRVGAGVLNAHVPEPGWRTGRELQRHAVAQPVPLAGAFELARVGIDVAEGQTAQCAVVMAFDAQACRARPAHHRQ